ncbi:MAG: murein biosynthesis integral membrane protein MurJ [Geminicoccaceae bacterium]
MRVTSFDPVRILQTGLRASAVWKSSSINRKITSSVLIIAAATLFVRSLTAGREIVVAYHFGTSDAIDAFVIAFVVPSFVFSIVVGSIRSSLIPTFVRISDNDGELAASRMASNVMAVIMAVSVALTAFIWLIGDMLIDFLGSNFSPEKKALTVSLQACLLPLIPLHGLVTFWGAILAARERFAATALTPVFIPAAVIILLIVSPSGGIYLLPAGMVIGYILQALWLGILSGRQSDCLIVPRWSGYDQPTRTVFMQYLPLLMAVLMTSGMPIVDLSMAAMLDAGSASSLNYGQKIVAVLMAFTAKPLGDALLPFLSRQMASGDLRKARHTMGSWIAICTLLSVPLTIVIFLFSETIVRVAFERGAFTAEDTVLVTAVQSMYIFQIPFCLIGMIASRTLAAIRFNQALVLVGGISFVVNIVLNVVLMNLLGLPGIALATTGVYFCSSIVLMSLVLYRLRKEIREGGPKPEANPTPPSDMTPIA